MTIPTDYISGTITLTNGSSSFTGNGTAWLAADFREGDLIIWVEGGEDFSSPIIQEILTNTTGTLTNSWAGPTVTNVPYRMRYQWDSSRVSAQARQLIEQLGNGNITSFSTLEGPGVPVFNGPHALTIKPETDFVNGVRYDVQVDLLADRDAYDGQSQGFSVLVSNIGDGRAAVYSKVSNAAGDWTNPAYVTGPLGASPTIEATVEMLTPGSDPIVNTNPITGGYSLDFELPAAEGFYWNSAYDSGISYNQSDVVRYNGSSFIAIQNVPPGQAPSNVFPPVDNAYWEILATRGVNGTGTVTELIEGSGIEIDSSDPENPIISLKLFEGDTGSGGTLGGVPAPSAGDAASNKFLSANGSWIAIDLSDLETTVSLLALQVADNTNSALFLGPTGNRFFDAFDTLTYVDVAGATNLDTSTTGVLKPTLAMSAVPGATGTLSGNMTGGGGLAAAFNGNTHVIASSGAILANSDNHGIIIKDWGSGNSKILNSAVVYGPTDSGIYRNSGDVSVSTNIYFSGSNNNTDWTDIDVKPTGSAGSTTITLTASVLTAYRYHRILVQSSTSGSDKFISQIVFSEVTGVNNLTVRSTSFTAAAAPSKMNALLLVKEIDSSVAGTDYLLDVSRDSGTTWSTSTLTELFTSPSPNASIIVVKSNDVDVTGQPTGTSPRYRIRTLNNKSIEFHATALYWT